VFTGIVEEMGTVAALGGGGIRMGAALVLEGTGLGDSISVNGACLTVTALDEGAFEVEVTPETFRKTNLGDLALGDRINLERPLAYGGRLGGHLVQGHVDGTGRVVSMTPEGNSVIAAFEAPDDIMRYVVVKGFIAVDGASLTVVSKERTVFTVAVIPYTRLLTVLGSRRPGDRVNIEVDILAKYVEGLLGREPEGQPSAQ
jgi:riboflavin synthase